MTQTPTNTMKGSMNEEKVSSYKMAGYKNPYHWVLEEAGAIVHAFQDFGSYQGDWLAKVTYKGKTGWIRDYYGSCSGCDAFEAESGYKDRTKREWHEFAVEFAKDYLEDVKTFDEVMKIAKENIEWDMNAKEMVKWLKKNKDSQKKIYKVDLTGLNTAGFKQMPNVLLSYDLAHPPVGKATIIDDQTVEVEFMEETVLMQEMEMQMVCLVTEINGNKILLALALEPKLKEQNG